MRALAVLLVVAACGGSVPPVAAPAPTPPPSNVEPAPPPVVKPPGYIEAHAQQAVATSSGSAVLLVVDGTELVIVIGIGDTEAVSIDHRLNGERFRRPLTHDLLDDAVQKLGGAIVKVHIDEIVENTFHATVFIRTGSRLLELDARASDAIALAIGNRVPIYVAQKVVDESALPIEELRQRAIRGPA